MAIEIRLNGETQQIPAPLSIVQLLDHFELPRDRVAVERNRRIVPRPQWESVSVGQGDELEVVHFVGGGEASINDGDSFVIAGRTFKSRLIVGTGKYPSHLVMKEAHERSGADMVTVAVRRIDLKAAKGESLLDYVDRNKIMILPNTADCYTVDEAVRTARLGREAGLSNWVKLELIGDKRTLFPDTAALVEATRILAKEDFVVLPYTNDDLVVARKLIDAGAAAIMPLGAPIGSGMGIQNVANMRILREMITEVPMIVDAGVGTASDAAIAMELGADGVLMNTAIAGAKDPGTMAEAMNYAIKAGRLAYKAGRIQRKLYATASSPLEGKI
jgi:thiazole synthase